jgi:hypothetical protein
MTLCIYRSGYWLTLDLQEELLIDTMDLQGLLIDTIDLQGISIDTMDLQGVLIDINS